MVWFWWPVLWMAHFILAQNPRLKNAALNKSCNMSSSYTEDGFNNNCSCAINGNTNMTYEEGNCIHTDDTVDDTPLWTVDMGQFYTIQKIVIYAREHEVNVRLRRVQVLVDQVGVYNFSETPSSVTSIGDNNFLPMPGKTVSLIKRNDNISRPMLNICEVQVFVSETYCVPNPCLKGTCVSNVNSHSCFCATGYTGSNCETELSDALPLRTRLIIAGSGVGGLLCGVLFAAGYMTTRSRLSSCKKGQNSPKGKYADQDGSKPAADPEGIKTSPEPGAVKVEGHRSAEEWDVRAHNYELLHPYNNDVTSEAQSNTDVKLNTNVYTIYANTAQ